MMSSIKKIAIIGAGQLGSRHVQGMAKSNLNISIEVVEPFEESRKIALQRLQEIAPHDKISKVDFYKSIEDLSNELFLVVVATTADVRYDVVKQLLETKKVKYLVLEKVLFQKIEHYREIEKLLLLTKTKAWVNHARRMYPFYKNLKERLKDTKNIHFSISGGAWGLGCNGLHFLDCVQYLLGSHDMTLDTRYLHTKIYNTKREGFKELNGLLIAKISNCTVAINCFEEAFSPLQFSITSNDLNIVIDETNGWHRRLEKNNNWGPKVYTEKIVYFQSEITNILLEDIVNERCCLPEYKEAMDLHIKYIDALINHINSFSKEKYDFCPIT